jgi:hypothetical protein
VFGSGEATWVMVTIMLKWSYVRSKNRPNVIVVFGSGEAAWEMVTIMLKWNYVRLGFRHNDFVDWNALYIL